MEADFQSHHGIDLDEPRYRAKSWRWFTVRVHGLLTDPDTRLHRFFFTPTGDDDTPNPTGNDNEAGVDGDGG